MNNFIDNNPWAGLSSYEDPEKAKREGRKPKLFCGRDEESHNVAQLIAGNIFVTLYGKSGTGKTSLLNAGVFPRLCPKRYLPVSIRLSMDAMDISFQQCIIKQLTQTLSIANGQQQTIDVVPLSTDEQQPDYLWSFFARTRFLDNEGRTHFPVIVLDQFEEVFRNRRDKAEVLLCQIAYLMDESHALTSRVIDGQSYKYDFNFRFVISIREDDLYRLEDCIDNNYLPELKRCRYRLRSLSEQGARDAILIPGEGLFVAEDQDDILTAIVRKSKNEDNSISTNIISLLCSRIFMDYQKTKTHKINLSLVENFIKDNPFEHFYNEATRGFSNKEKSYIEDHFVDSTGRRNSIPESDFMLHVPNGKQLIEGHLRILQRSSTSSNGGNYRIELIHDSFCMPLVGQKAKREKQKRMRYWIATIGALCIALVIILAIYYQMVQIENSNRKEQATTSRFIAEKSSMLVDTGDSYTAQLLLRAFMTEDRPYVTETEDALRKSMRYDCMAFRSDSSEFRDIYFSPNGKYIATNGSGYNYIIEVSSGRIVKAFKANTIGPQPFINNGKHFLIEKDSKLFIEDFSTGEKVDSLEALHYAFRSIAFSVDGKHFVTTSIFDNKIRLYKTEEKICIKSIWLPQRPIEVCFSPTGNQFLSYFENKVSIWNSETGNKLFDYSNFNYIESVKYNYDGSRIMVSDLDTFYEIDAMTGQYLAEMDKRSKIDESLSYGKWLDATWMDSGLIALAQRNGVVTVWELMKRKPYHYFINYLRGNYKETSKFVFASDGRNIAAVSGSHELYVWGTYPNPICGLKRNVSISGSQLFRRAGFYNGGDYVVTVSNEKIIMWDIKTGKHVRSFGNKVYIASISPNDKYIACGNNDGTVSVWDVSTGEHINSFKGYGKNVLSLSFSHNNQYLATTEDCNSDDKKHSVKIWEVQSGKCIAKFNIAVATSSVLANQLADFSLDGHYLAVATHWQVRLYNFNTKEWDNEKMEHNAIVNSVSFSPDGRYLVSASYDKSIRVWDLSSKRCVHILEGHTGNVCSARFSPDGKYIISASDDESVRIWNTKNGKCIEELYGHTDCVSSAAFSSDGKCIVSISRDSTIRVWDFPSVQALLDKSRKRFKNRQLTSEERRKYYLE